MTSAEIRQNFLRFFEQKGHQIVPSAPLVLKNDPTLLFTNSGMVQFKDYFLGNAVPKSRRIADTQKCLRVSGKHNDLEDVGLDTYHQTMFEMLGNWSFGDYFKKEAIEWAWELLTQVYKLPKDRMYATVFGGDPKEGLTVDQEALDLWSNVIGSERVLHGSKKDNFWEMGDTGPCGPCSEIHIDIRPESERKKSDGKSLVNTGHPQVVEIWNLVFIQFNRMASGKLEPLPERHVDTGMGFERLCMAIQGKTSNYETDVFTPLMDFICQHSGVTYGQTEKTDIAIRVVADHVRAVSFAICDGQLPSNTGAGYVIRRILRRAVRYAFSTLQLREPFLFKLVPLLARQFQQVFPEIHAQQDHVGRVIHEEEMAFLRTLEKGLRRMEGLTSISGEQAFELYDTYGFPLDLTALIARERGFTVDEAGFRAEMEKQKSRSKADAARETGDWIILHSDLKPEFVGYDVLSTESKIVRHRKIRQKNRDLYQVVLDRTPFYAESGGQIGDTGTLTFSDGSVTEVVDTKKENELVVHLVASLPANPSQQITARVAEERRSQIMNNHSATHLLHAALRSVLGKHVEQRGSLVNDEILRFDFSHFAAMTQEELDRVEDIVNARIRQNINRDEKRNVPIAEAKAMGAMALFGEKYGDNVRVITFDPGYSVELCGGTHVVATGVIGHFRIVSEGSVAAGIRRIEAVTAQGAAALTRSERQLLSELKQLFRNPKSLVQSAENLISEKAQLEKQLEALHLEQANILREKLAGQVQPHNGRHELIVRVRVPSAEALKNIAFGLRNQFKDLVLVLAAEADGKPQVAVALGDDIVAAGKLHAGNLVRELAKEIDGGGGGQPFFATAGGKRSDGLDAVLSKATQLLS